MALLLYNLHPHLSSLSTLTKMSAHTFAGGLIHGTILAPTGVNIIPIFQLCHYLFFRPWNKRTQPPNFSDFLC